MKKIAILLLLLVVQSVSAQNRYNIDNWDVFTDVNPIDDSVSVSLYNIASEVGRAVEFATLIISCHEEMEYPMVSFSPSEKVFIGSEDDYVEVNYRIGADESVIDDWQIWGESLYFDGDGNSSSLTDGNALVAALVEDNSRFVFQLPDSLIGQFTAIFDTEGIAEVIDECLTVLKEKGPLNGNSESLGESDDWEIETDTDIIDDSVTVTLQKRVDRMEGITESWATDRSSLTISCAENRGYPIFFVIMLANADFIRFPEGLHEATYRVGTDEPVTHEWQSSNLSLEYRTPYIDDGSGFAGTDDATALVAALVQDNSRFILRTSPLIYPLVTAIWNMEGLAEVIDQCMAVFD